MIEIDEKNVIESVNELFDNYNFEDIFIKFNDENNDYINLAKKWKIYKKVLFNDNFIKDFKNSKFYQEKFSYSVKWKNNVFFRIARVWEKFTIRKLWFTFDFYEIYRVDQVLFNFVNTVLLQNYNKTLLISWRTWSWKTTFILSLLNMINDYNYEKIVEKQLKKVLKKMLKEKKIEIKITKNNITQIIQDYLDKKEIEILEKVVWEFLDNIKIKNLLENYEGGSVFTIEKPIEYFFDKDLNLFFNQNEVDSKNSQIANESYIKLVDTSLQSNPSIIYISEIKNKTEYERFLDTIYVWPAVIASNHANSVFQNLKRIESVSNNIKEIKSKITMGLWWLINLERYEVVWDKIYLSSYELLKMYEKDVRWSYFSNNDDVFYSQMLIEYRNKNYYISHEISLLYNMLLHYLSWKQFFLKKFKKDEQIKILNDNRQLLKDIYNISDEAVNFLETQIYENYEKFKNYL